MIIIRIYYDSQTMATATGIRFMARLRKKERYELAYMVSLSGILLAAITAAYVYSWFLIY